MFCKARTPCFEAHTLVQEIFNLGHNFCHRRSYVSQFIAWFFEPVTENFESCAVWTEGAPHTQRPWLQLHPSDMHCFHLRQRGFAEMLSCACLYSGQFILTPV
eukprot:EG_transcript_1579